MHTVVTHSVTAPVVETSFRAIEDANVNKTLILLLLSLVVHNESWIVFGDYCLVSCALHSVSFCHTRSRGVKYILIQLEFTSDASPATMACSLFHSRAEVLATVDISFDIYLYLEKASN